MKTFLVTSAFAAVSSTLASAASFHPSVTVEDVFAVTTGTVDSFFRQGNSYLYATGNQVFDFDQPTTSTTTVGTFPTSRVAGVSVVLPVPATSDLLTADGRAFFPDTTYDLGTFGGSGYTFKQSLKGVYSGAIQPGTGRIFLAADAPGTSNTSIFLFDVPTNTLTEVINVGGYSGGLAFDASGNLFYGFVDPAFNAAANAIYRFESAILEDYISGSDLSLPVLSDGVVMASNINASALALTDTGNLFVRTLRNDFSGSDILALDQNGDTLGTVAAIDGFGESFLELFSVGDDLYTAINAEGQTTFLKLSDAASVPESSAASFGFVFGLVGLLAARKSR